MKVNDCNTSSVAGARPLLRMLWWFERDALEAHLLRLDEEDRYRRFGAHLSDEGVRNRARRMQGPGTIIVAALVDGQVRGTAEIDLAAPGRHRPAEIALTVEGGYRGLGLGARLFKAGCLLANNRGATHLVLTTQADNWAMQHIARAHGMHIRKDGADLAASLALPGPNLAGYIQELTLLGHDLLWVSAACLSKLRLTRRTSAMPRWVRHPWGTARLVGKWAADEVRA